MTLARPLQTPGRWATILIIFGLAGPAIGLIVYEGVQIARDAVREGLPALFGHLSEVVGLTPSGALLCYLAAPAALATGVCMKLCEARLPIAGLVGLIAVLGALLSSAWYVAGYAVFSLAQSVPILDLLGIAGMGAVSSVVCTLLARRRLPAGQQKGGMTQDAA